MDNFVYFIAFMCCIGLVGTGLAALGALLSWVF